MIKIASWNVNSLRMRLGHLENWLSTQAIDVLALQETKCQNEQFPTAAIEALSYQVMFDGQKTFNGVACLTKQAILTCDIDSLIQSHEQKRFLAVVYQDILIVNVYVPNGQAIGSEKYHYKLAWLDMLFSFIEQAQKTFAKIVILGDFNIAPTLKDHTSANFIHDDIMRSPEEQALFQRMLAMGFVDSFRLFNQQEKQYTWWDYRIKAFDKNLGYRIDHILVSTALVPFCVACDIDKTPRTWAKPSDHTPIVLTLSL